MSENHGTGVLHRSKKIATDVVKSAHHHVAKRPHNYLMAKSTRYAKWHNWRGHSHVHALITVGGIGVMLFAGLTHNNAFAASSWIQTDWTGGTGPSSTNQFASVSNLDTSVASNLKLTQSPNWFNSSWTYRKKLSFNNTDSNLGTASETMTDFTVLVKLSSSNFDYSKAKSDGSDLRFALPSAPTTALSYEIDSWNTSGTSNIWVKVPSITANTSTDYMYMYYGNSSATDGQAKTATWPSQFKGVYHYSETSGQHHDSTVNNNTSGSVGATTQGGPLLGIVGGGDNLNGSNQTTVVPQSSSLNISGNTMTLEAWVSERGCGVDDALVHKENNYTIAILSRGSPTSCGLSYADGSNWSYANFGTYGSFPTDDTLHDVVAVKDNSTITIYLDGVVVVSKSFGGYVNGDTNDVYLGSYNTNDFLNGRIDEARISTAAESHAWVTANYKSTTDQFLTYGTQEAQYASSGTLTSNIFDTTTPSDWGAVSYTADVPTGTSLTVKVRSGNQADLSDASAFTSCSALASGDDVTSTCAPDIKHYVQYQVVFTSSAQAATPNLESIAIAYSASDTVPPITNASAIGMADSHGGTSITENAWTNASTPYFSWTAGADDVGGSGIKGYCLYLGHDSTADVTTTKGILGTSPVVTDGACSYEVAGTTLDLASVTLGTPLTTSDTPYYLIIKAIDHGDNLYPSTAAAFHFKFDNTPPTVPTFVTAPSQFISTKQVTLTWPTTGSDAAADDNSGISGLQYRIGSSGTWYGKNHVGNTLSDVLDNNGSYATVSSPDFANLSDGNNIVSFRAIDSAGNISSAYVTTVVKINTSSPSSPRSVTATPGTNSVNSFAFSWVAPASFTGSASNLTYCYTVNAIPTLSNCTYTAAGVTSLPAGAYATQPGDNTFYVVAKDEAGNINVATAASTTFTANTSAPSMPLNAEIADISNKATSTWKLALSWNQPADTGAGISTYNIARSTNGTSFSQVATSAGASYVDNGLTNGTTYYYKVRACDSANNCGAYSSIVSKVPTGRFTTPPELIAQPSVVVSTRTATITWSTDRNSDSRVQYGTTSGVYLPTEAASSDSTKVHTIEMNNLSAGTTYYYKARWIDEDGNIGSSSELAFTTLPAPAIKDVKIVHTTLSTATLQFTSTNATSVKLYFGKGASFGGLKTVNTSQSESTYTVELDGLDDGATYQYKLNPIDVDGNEYDSTQQSSFSTPERPRISDLRFQPVADKPTSTQLVTWTTNVPTTSLVRYSAAGIPEVEVVSSDMVTSHQLTIEDLQDDTNYSLVAESRDAGGNLAASDSTAFKTALDTRPPAIANVNVQTSIRGNGADARGQIIIAWKTDEPATSQVAYRTGRGNEYTSKTAEDTKLTTDHVVVVSDLSPSNVYHVQTMSKDKAGNQALGEDAAAIIGRPTDNVMTIILTALQKAFGF